MKVDSDQQDLGEDEILPDNIPPISAGILILYVLGGLVAGFWCWSSGRVLLEPTGFLPFIQEMVVASLVALATLMVVGLIWKYTTYLRPLESELAARLGNLSMASVLKLALASSIAEELFFRGAFQPWVATHLDSEMQGLAVTSIFFGLLHTGPSRRFLPWTVFAVAAGFILGGTYIWSRNIFVPIFIHFAINAVNIGLIVRRARRGYSLPQPG